MTKITKERNWQDYYNAIVDRPPRKTILTALSAFDTPGIAIDLGCGDGRDAIEMLRQNWAVLAIDQEPDAITRLLARPNFNTLQLTTQIVSFEQLELPEQVNLINASFSLPFCATEAFPRLWNQIYHSLVSGGRFSGHLFGNQDSWANTGLINTFTLPQVENLLKPYNIELLEEEQHLGKTPLGEARYWHVFHLVVRK